MVSIFPCVKKNFRNALELAKKTILFHLFSSMQQAGISVGGGLLVEMKRAKPVKVLLLLHVAELVNTISYKIKQILNLLSWRWMEQLLEPPSKYGFGSCSMYCIWPSKFIQAFVGVDSALTLGGLFLPHKIAQCN